MKKALKLVIFFTLMAVISCKEIKEKLLPSFNAKIPDIRLTIPPVSFVSNKEIPVCALKTHVNMDSTIRANTKGAFGAGAVSSVKIKKIVITLLKADAKNNLANIETARMRIYSDTAEADIAFIKFPDSYSSSLTFVPEKSPEISKFLRGSELSYNLFWKNRRPTSKFLKLVVSVSLSVQ